MPPGLLDPPPQPLLQAKFLGPLIRACRRPSRARTSSLASLARPVPMDSCASSGSVLPLGPRRGQTPAPSSDAATEGVTRSNPPVASHNVGHGLLPYPRQHRRRVRKPPDRPPGHANSCFPTSIPANAFGHVPLLCVLWAAGRLPTCHAGLEPPVSVQTARGVLTPVIPECPDLIGDLTNWPICKVKVK